MRTVRYHPQARTEFLEQVHFYAEISPRLAEHFDRAVPIAETQAVQMPEAWPKYKGRTRRIVDRQFKFSLVYVYGEDDVYIVAVAPMRRKPGYWRASLSFG